MLCVSCDRMILANPLDMIQYARSSYYYNNMYVFEDVPIVVCFCIGMTISEIERVIDPFLAFAI